MIVNFMNEIFTGVLEEIKKKQDKINYPSPKGGGLITAN